MAHTILQLYCTTAILYYDTTIFYYTIYYTILYYTLYTVLLLNYSYATSYSPVREHKAIHAIECDAIVRATLSLEQLLRTLQWYRATAHESRSKDWSGGSSSTGSGIYIYIDRLNTYVSQRYSSSSSSSSSSNSSHSSSVSSGSLR